MDMKDLINKITPYNLFNYLLPGVLFVVIIEELTIYSVITDNMVLAAFICYFVGMVISRVGSLIVEAPLKKVGFLKFKNYKDFVTASKKDARLDTLSEQNNTYRTLIAMLIMVGVTKGYEWLGTKFEFLEEWKLLIVFMLLLILFLAAYRKQTNYITQRIEKNLE